MMRNQTDLQILEEGHSATVSDPNSNNITIL